MADSAGFLYTRPVREVVQLLNDLKAAGSIREYAIFGAIAQSRYTQPAATLDVDVLVTLQDPHQLDARKEIYQLCASRNYPAEGEAIRVGDWPVQFVPVFSQLTGEAVEQAETTTFEGLACRVLRPDYLAVIALSTGRAKDYERILSLLASGKLSTGAVQSLAVRHGLSEAWQRFARRFLDE